LIHRLTTNHAGERLATVAATVEIDFAALIGDVARHLLGQPTKRLSTRRQLRFGSKGAIAVEIAGSHCGTWFDHSDGIGGGTLDLIIHARGGTRADALAWLQSERLVDTDNNPDREKDNPVATRKNEPEQHQTLAPWARRLWETCRPITAGDPAGQYLRARGCALP
jgi:hypothetical protein